LEANSENDPLNLLLLSKDEGLINALDNSISIELPVQSLHLGEEELSNGQLHSEKLRARVNSAHNIILLDMDDMNVNCIREVLSFISDTHQLRLICIGDKSTLSTVEALQQGAVDFIESSNIQHLELVIHREISNIKPLMMSSNQMKSSERDFTGLYSRKHFLQQFEQQKETYKVEHNYALLYLQLDNFSWINESIGIDQGDLYLKNTAQLITALIDENELSARYQGGSFVLVIKADCSKKILAKADMIREAIGESTLEQNGTIISSSCSIGIRVLVDSSESQDVSINRAFEASQTARGNGGNSIHIFQNSDEKHAEEKVNNAWDVRIRDAFNNDQFQLFYQPIVSLQGDTKERYEVLLRMIDDDGNIVAPGTFLPSAERAGLMADIDRRVITYSLEKAQEQQDKGIETEMFIKLSAKSLDDKSMPSWIGKILTKYNIDNHNIVFEITESLALTQLAQARRLVDSLQKLDCKVTIDHFGKRVKSFSLLNQLEINYLKLDPSLVFNLASSKSSQVIVKKIFRDAQKKNIKVMAVSVQDVNTLPTIWQYGFDFVQGYFLQIPDENMEYDFSNLLF